MQKCINYRGALRQLSDIIKSSRAKKIFLVTGKKSFSNSVVCQQLLNDLSNFDVFRFQNFDVNPNSQDLKKGITLATEFCPDMIIGIGGGSVMDMAKLISKFWDVTADIEPILKNNAIVKKRNLPFVLIPTTAGSGSEATHFAVIYINKIKYSYASDCLLPDYTILDVTLTDHIPKNLTAITAFDAFSQAVESFWSVNSNVESRVYSEKSISIIIEIFEDLVSNPTPIVRDKMLEASNLAGKAINITKTTAPHALSYFFTSNYGIPHGHAVAITLPLFLIFNDPESGNIPRPELEVVNYRNNYRRLLHLLKVNNSMEAQNKIFKMIDKCGFNTSLNSIGMKSKEEIIKAAKSVNYQRLGNNPMEVTENNIVELLTEIF
jgi:alcohol dehydrogenase class IV